VSILVSSPLSQAETDEWRDHALCRDTDPDLFFPVGTTGVALVSIDHAKAVCAQCNVTQECLDFALDTNQDSGVWGGLSEEERRAIRRQRAAARRAARTAV
jgi:WhiB family redox-sensing transcriptional regulator